MLISYRSSLADWQCTYSTLAGCLRRRRRHQRRQSMQAEVDCAAVHLILGGPRSREYSAVRQLPPSARAVVLSSGALSERDLRIAVNEKANAISDRRALDTVTNFSTIVGDLLDAGISSVSVYTDRAHWCRAAAVGQIILGARGIRCSTFAVEEASSSE